MAEPFIGQRVLVTLKVPEGRQVEGVVAQVLTDTSTLVLRNGKLCVQVQCIAYHQSCLPI
jgi:hypothetical protein